MYPIHYGSTFKKKPFLVLFSNTVIIKLNDDFITMYLY